MKDTLRIVLIPLHKNIQNLWQEELEVAPEEHNVLITEYSKYSKENKKNTSNNV